MSNVQNIKDKVDAFYNDLYTIMMNRIKKNKDKIDQNNEEEKKLIEEKNILLEKIDQIKNNKENHINNNLEYHLIPKSYVDVDRYEKEIEYKDEQLKFMCEEHKEEKEELITKNNKYILELEKYFKEKEGILKCILNREEFERLKVKAIHEQEIENLRKINDNILQNYINIGETNSSAAPMFTRQRVIPFDRNNV